MADKPVPESSFMAPQPGDPGYKPLPPVPKGFGMTKSEKRPSEVVAEAKKEEVTPAASEKDAKKGGKKTEKKVVPVSKAGAKGDGKPGGDDSKGASNLPVKKGGLNLLKDDLLKNAPSFAGVGRQDVSGIMKPMAGEPGYKPQAYETVRVSELGISPFPDDANAVGKVGGIKAVKKAAVEVKQGSKTADEVKKEVLKIDVKKEKDQVFDIPDYLKPIPEDNRMTYTWKNYKGR